LIVGLRENPHVRVGLAENAQALRFVLAGSRVI
jgi:hypothetical protein